MSILWLIIKIILIILIAILMLAFAIVSIVLLAPIRYEAYLAKYEALAYDIKFTYLLGIKGIFYLEGQEKNHKVSVFGKLLYKNTVAEEKEESKTVSKDQELHLKKKEKFEETFQKQEAVNKEKKASKHATSKKQDVKIINEVNPGIQEDIEEGIEEVGDVAKDEIIETVDKMSYSWVKKFVSDKNTYSALKQIIKCIWHIIRYVFPDEWDFELVIGTGDPADTGETIAKLTMFYPLYYQHGIIRGDYEKECVEGGFLVKGKFTIGGILWHILRCVLTRQVRNFIKLILQLRKDESDGK